VLDTTGSPVPRASTADDDDRLDAIAAAEFLRVSPKTLEKWKAQGWIRYFKVGRRVQYAKADLRDFVAAGEHPAENERPAP
jgi:excisionase family DNA binding protein